MVNPLFAFRNYAIVTISVLLQYEKCESAKFTIIVVVIITIQGQTVKITVIVIVNVTNS